MNKITERERMKVRVWNERNRPGQEVVVNEPGEKLRKAKTISLAFLESGHTAKVLLDDCKNAIDLDYVTAIDELVQKEAEEEKPMDFKVGDIVRHVIASEERIIEAIDYVPKHPKRRGNVRVWVLDGGERVNDGYFLDNYERVTENGSKTDNGKAGG